MDCSRFHVSCTEVGTLSAKTFAEKLCTIISKKICRYAVQNHVHVEEQTLHGVLRKFWKELRLMSVLSNCK